MTETGEPPSIAAIVLTQDEEENLPGCLESIEPVAAEIHVVDSGSTDNTVKIAEKRGAQVHHHPFENYGAQRNWAMDNLPIEQDWVLHVDADERLSDELRQEIPAAVRDAPDDVDGYMVARRTVFLGRWIKHGGLYPTYHLRLMRRGAGRCEDRRYDQHFMVEGDTEQLDGDLVDVNSESLERWVARHNRWASAEAREVLSRDTAGRVEPDRQGSPIERRRWLRNDVYYRFPPFLRVFLYFLYRYVLRGGFRDGKEGLVYHVLQGFWFRFLVDANILELKLDGEGP